MAGSISCLLLLSIFWSAAERVVDDDFAPGPDVEAARVVTTLPPMCQQRRLLQQGGAKPETSSPLVWSPDGSRLLQVRNVGTVFTIRIADWTASRLVSPWNVTGLRAVTWLPTGQILAVGEQHSDVCCLLTWTSSGEPLQTFTIPREKDGRKWLWITATALSPDGTTFFIAGKSFSGKRLAQFWNVSNIGHLGQHGEEDIQDVPLSSQNYCNAAVWSPSSSVLVTVTTRGMLNLWKADDTGAWRQRLTIKPPSTASVLTWMKNSPHLPRLAISDTGSVWACERLLTWAHRGDLRAGHVGQARTRPLHWRDICQKVLVPEVPGVTAAEPCFCSQNFCCAF